MKREYAVKLFILGLAQNRNNLRTEIIEANSQDEAEQIAHNWYVADGWGVLESRPILRKGDKVRWNNPAIDDYDEEDRESIKNRIFEIISDVYGDEDEIIEIAEVDGRSEAEVYAYELELVA